MVNQIRTRDIKLYEKIELEGGCYYMNIPSTERTLDGRNTYMKQYFDEDDNCHRLDGAAIIFNSGHKIYYIHGERINEINGKYPSDKLFKQYTSLLGFL